MVKILKAIDFSWLKLSETVCSIHQILLVLFFASFSEFCPFIVKIYIFNSYNITRYILRVSMSMGTLKGGTDSMLRSHIQSSRFPTLVARVRDVLFKN